MRKFRPKEIIGKNREILNEETCEFAGFFFSANAKRFFYGLISDKHFPDLVGQFRLHTGGSYPEFLAKQFRNNFAYVNPVLLPCPFLVKRKRPTAVMLCELSLDVEIHAYSRLISGRKRYFKFLCQCRLTSRVELYDKIRRINMFAEQTPLLVLEIHIPHRREEREWLWLILEILKNRQLTGFARPVDKVDFFCRIHRQLYAVNGVFYCQLFTFVLASKLSHFISSSTFLCILPRTASIPSLCFLSQAPN